MPESIIDRIADKIDAAALQGAWLDGLRTGGFAVALALVLLYLVVNHNRK